MSRESVPKFNRAKWAQHAFLKSASQPVQIDFFSDDDYTRQAEPLPGELLWFGNQDQVIAHE